MKKIILVFIFLLCVSFVSAYEYCYQGLANESSSCGGVANPSAYLWQGTHFEGEIGVVPVKGYDNNWDTATNVANMYSPAGPHNINITWIKPLVNGSSTIKVKYISDYTGGITTANLSFSSSCWNYSSYKLIFIVSFDYFAPYGYTDGNRLHLWCYNGTWEEMSYYVGTPMRNSFYEAGMNWDIVKPLIFSPTNNSILPLHNLVNLTANITETDFNNVSYYYYINDVLNQTTDSEVFVNLSSGNYNLSVVAFVGLQNSTRSNYSYFRVNTPPTANETFVINVSAGYNCSYIYSDYDGDLENLTWFKWYINNTESSITNQVIGAGNISSGSNITCLVLVYDGHDNSTWYNTTKYLVGDFIKPQLLNYSLPVTSYQTGNSINFYINASDNSAIAWVRVDLVKPNGNKDTRQLTYVSGNQYVLTIDYGVIGTYNITSINITDGNSNRNNTYTNISFTISAVPIPPSSPPSSGGSGGTRIIGNITFKPAQLDQYFLIFPFIKTRQNYNHIIKSNIELADCTSEEFECDVNENEMNISYIYYAEGNYFTDIIEGNIKVRTKEGTYSDYSVRLSIVNFGVYAPVSNLGNIDFPLFFKVQDGKTIGIFIVPVIILLVIIGVLIWRWKR